MIKGALLSDAIVILSSLNVIAGELDINYGTFLHYKTKEINMTETLMNFVMN
jgi:hypothetical protein